MNDIIDVTNDALPPSIADAITKVMEAVPKLEKTEKNTHGSYNFASIDDFLEAVRPLCAKNGLIIIQDEEAFEARDSWLTMTFAFTLAHTSGETWTRRPRRTIMVSSKMGAQAFGAAQSYALKQFMRSLFQIATGEKGQDADEHPNADLPNREKKATDDDWKGPLKKMALKAEIEKVKDAIRAAVTLEAVDHVAVTYKAVLGQARMDLPSYMNSTDADRPGVQQIAEMIRAQIRAQAQEIKEQQKQHDIPADPDSPGSYLDE